MTLTKYSNTELLDYPDCLGLSERGTCTWLAIPKCLGKNCKFMKATDKNNSKVLLYQRLESLNEDTQAHISKKYYNGKRPWIKNIEFEKENKQ